MNTFSLNWHWVPLSAIEYVPLNRRAIIGNLSLAVGFTLAGVYEPWLLKWLQDWKLLQYVVYAQVVIVLGTPWYLHESIEWLVCKGLSDRCIPIVKRIASTNGKVVQEEILESFKVKDHSSCPASYGGRLKIILIFLCVCAEVGPEKGRGGSV